MKLKQILAISACILALGMAQSAAAFESINFQFDETGAGLTANSYSDLDQKQGNALAIGGVTAIENFLINADSGSNLSTEFTLAYQANLGSLTGAFGGSDYSNNNTDGHFFNFTMQFQEKVTSVTGNTVEFDFVNSGTNIFTMYHHTALANNLTGADFGSGTPILIAKVSSSVSSNYTSTGGSENLDQFLGPDDGAGPADSWDTQQTVLGSGATDLLLEVTFADTLYFPDLEMASLITFAAFNTSQVTPFKQVDPSQNFLWTAGGAIKLFDDTDPLFVSPLGDINGGAFGNGTDFLFQADGNTSMTRIPEPATLMLLGLGLAGLSRSRRRI